MANCTLESMLVLKWHSLGFLLASREKKREVVTRLSQHNFFVGHQAARVREQGPIGSGNPLGRGFRCMLYWNGPNRAPGLAAAPPFVCCLCTSLVLHLGCVSFERHVNADCPVQMTLSFLLAWLRQPLLQIPSYTRRSSEAL